MHFQLFIFYRSVDGSPAKLDQSDWFPSQLTIQGRPCRIGDVICALNLKNLLLLHQFHLLLFIGSYLSIFCEFFFLPRRKKVGSRDIDLFFIHRHLSTRPGFLVLSPGEKNVLMVGPTCRF